MNTHAILTRKGLLWGFAILAMCILAPLAMAQDDGQGDNNGAPTDENAPPPQDGNVPLTHEAPAEPAPPPPPAPEPQQMNVPPQPEPESEPAPEPAAEAPAPPPPPTRPPSPLRPRPVSSALTRPSKANLPSAAAPGAAAASGEITTGSNPNDPKDGRSASAPMLFDFENVELSLVIESIAKMTGKNFDIDPNIGQTRVTVITHDKIPPEMAYQVLESILATRGFSMVETLDGKLIKIVASGKSREKFNLYTGEGTAPPGFDTYSTHIIQLKFGDSAALSTILQKIGSETCMIDVYAPNNMLIITDISDGLRRIFKFIEQVDVAGNETEVKIFPLEYTRAEILSQQIQEVLLDVKPAGQKSGPQSAASAVRPPTRPTQRNVPGQAAPVVIGNREETLRIVPDERLNSIIVIATSAMMERVRDLVTKLDTPTPYESNNMNVYELMNADAEEIEKALNQLLNVTPRKASATQGAAQQEEVQPFEKKVLITKYEQSNALLILASPQDYKLLKEIIGQLDVPMRQVHVEGVIMDVKISDNFSLVVDQAAITGNDGFAVGNTSTIRNLGVGDVTTLATQLASGQGVAEANRAIQAMSLGQNGGFAAGVYDSLKVGTIAGRKVEIPFVPLLIKAVETLTDVDILSQPSLTTQNNEEASILVGSEVPVPTMRSGYSGYDSTGTTSGGTAANRNNYGSNMASRYGSGIQREDVGIKLSVKPRINEGDYVNVETEITVSQQAATDTSAINPADLGPTFIKSEVKNNVIVKDGCTGVIAGLISESNDRKKTRVPLLGDLPLIGWMFGSKTANREKRNLVVLLTPHIIKEGVDLDRVTAYKMDELRTANVDLFFEKGYIKKVKKRWFLRNMHRPSVERSQAITKDNAFSRSELEEK